MVQEEMFFDSPEDALKAAVQSLGGAKKVGAQIWPDKTADDAGRLLSNCLDANRAEKLRVGQIMFILRLAKEAGHHSPFYWMAKEIGYCAKPVVREEEVDRLTTVIERASVTLAGAVAALERVKGGR